MFVVGGESLIDLKEKPVKDGVMPLTAHPGGSPMNCAIALRRLGHDTGFLCPISADKFGGMILAPLKEAGVKVLLKERVREPTTLAVVSDDGKGNPRYGFYRHADRAFTQEGLVAALPKKIELFQFGGFCPIEAYDARAWLATAKAAAAAGATISIDPNVRPAVIGDMAAYKQRLGRMLDLAHLIKVSHEDLDYLEPGKPLEAHAAALLARPNTKLVVITRATDGSVAFTRDARAESPIYPAKRGGDNVGAGDTLMAGILTWLRDKRSLPPAKLAALSGDQLGSMLWFGAVAAGINCSRVGANPPTRAEVDAVLAKRPTAA
ncbi:MAG TPA: PfkB family carbohydrate kinase [Devosia sp.]|jgi:fructokinase|nr:PfkB family carbohydrate kinase [Devosia sp.]